MILAFPAAASARLLSHVNLHALDGRLFASAGFLPGDPGAAWAWIVETVTAECECTEAQVNVGEDDTVTIDGLPVYTVEIIRPRCFLKC